MERLTSRKFILAIVAGLVVFLNGAFDLGLNAQEVTTIVIALLTFVGVEGAIDFKKEGK